VGTEADVEPGRPPPTRGTAVALSALSVASFAITAWFALGPLGAMAHVSDEANYLVQARIFAEGSRSVASPPYWGFRPLMFLFMKPEMYSAFPPGWPLVLAAGVKLGVPFLVNPALSAALPWAGWLAYRRLLPGEAVHASAILALSPGVLLLGGSLMSHTLVLVLAALAAAGVQARGRAGALAGGLALGFLALCRPYDAFLLGLPLGVWALARRNALFLLGTAVGVALVLLDNAAMTGSPLSFPINAWFDREQTEWGQALRPGCNRLGFGPDRDCRTGHGFSPSDAGRAFGLKLSYADRLFLGFRGSLLLAAAGLPSLVRRGPALVAIGLVVPLGYLFYWSPGVCYGSRFWSAAMIGFAPAAALALHGAVARWPRLRLAAVAVPVAGLVSILPPLATELGDRYWCVDTRLRDEVSEHGVTAGVILVDDQGGYPAALALTAPPALQCDASVTLSGLVGLNGVAGEPVVWLTAAGDPEAVARGVQRKTPGVEVYLLQRDLAAGTAAFSHWDGEAFGP
jgi:hypothetical protein